jgi:hypothetical protein
LQRPALVTRRVVTLRRSPTSEGEIGTDAMKPFDNVLAFAGPHARPASLLVVNLCRFKLVNVFLGHSRADRLLRYVEGQLEEIGRTWRLGSEFVTVASGSATAVTAKARTFSWAARSAFTVTESWIYRFGDNRGQVVVPHRHFEVICTPRFGLAELEGDARTALVEAIRQCDESGQSGNTPYTDGFAPMPREGFSNEHRLAEHACPGCGHPGPTVIDEDLGYTKERCPECSLEYERYEQQAVLGQTTEGGYM